MGRLAALLLAVAAVSGTAAAQDSRPSTPPGAVVRLEADRADWLLGEDVVVRLVVENRGTKPFTVRLGGDIRGTTRPVRFTVTATREDGREAPDPWPDQDCSGGPAWEEIVEPGGEWISRVYVASYRVIDGAGPWTVTVHHDLGWKDAPAASLRLRFRPPLPLEARVLVAIALSADGSRWSYGYPENPRAPRAPTLDGIFHAHYLLALRDAARRGEERAVDPLSRISTPGATRTLAALLRVPRTPVAAAAAEALAWRIPDPDHPDRPALGYGFVWEDPSDFDRARVAAWVPALVPEIRAASRRFVKGTDPFLRAAGALLLSRLAEKEDYGVVAGALAAASREEREAGTPPEDWWTDARLRARRSALVDLRTAVERVGRLGALPPADPRTEAEAFLWLASLGEDPAARPAGWEGILAGLLGHGSAGVRRGAVAKVEAPAAGSLRKAFEAVLLDEDREVAAAACLRATGLADRSFLDAVLASARKATSKRHLEVSLEAAAALGDRLDGLHVLVDRIDHPELGFAAVCILVERFSPRLGGHSVSGTSDGEMKEIQKRWRVFLAVHGTEIKAGKRFVAGDGFVTRDLFPPGTNYSLGGNEMGWPGK